VRVFDSEANLLMIRVPQATKVWNALAEHGVLVRNFDQPGTLTENCLRVTIGTPEENDLFLSSLTSGLSASR
jgi:histidinol-phosphate aminotransferase